MQGGGQEGRGQGQEPILDPVGRAEWVERQKQRGVSALVLQTLMAEMKVKILRTSSWPPSSPGWALLTWQAGRRTIPVPICFQNS